MCPQMLSCDLSFPFAEPETPREKDKPAALKKGTVFAAVHTVIVHISII